jgi:hypothetical protein
MNSKLLFAAALAIAVLSSGAAMASEATQFAAPTGKLTRTEVKAELKRAQAAGELSGPTATYGDFDETMASTRTRDDVRAEARAEARTHRVASQYSGS